MVVVVVVDVDVVVVVDRVVVDDVVVVPGLVVVTGVVDPGCVVDRVSVVGTAFVAVVCVLVTVHRAARARRASVSCCACTKRVRAFRSLWARKNFAFFAAIDARKRASACCRVTFCACEHVAAALRGACGASAWAVATPTIASAQAASRPRPPW